MKRTLGLIPLALLFLAGCLSATGCAPRATSMADADANRQSWLSALRAAKAKGHFRMEQGGSPLSIGQKTVFFAGPENMSMMFDGSVDFSGYNNTPGEPGF